MKRIKTLSVFMKSRVILVALALIVSVIGITSRQSAFAACPTLPTTNGTVTQTVSIPTDGTYTIWSRINTPDNASNSYYLEIDDTTCGVVVNGKAITLNTWTWVNYKDGNTASKITANLTAGNHTVKMIGKEAGVQLDRVIFTTDANCTPTGTGENCANPPDTTPPTTAVTAPTAGATISNNFSVTASAADDVAVTKVEFYIDGVLKNTDTASPYTFVLNTTTLTNGQHSFTTKAYDANNVTTSAAIQANVSNTTIRSEDINSDGSINLLDFSLLASKFGQTGGTLGRSDINGDGRVNLLDFSLLAAKFGT